MIITNIHDTLFVKKGEGTIYGSLDVADVAQWAIGGNLTNNGLIGFWYELWHTIF